MGAAREVKASLDPLTPEEADFMMRHANEIATFTGQTSTWLGVSAVVLEKHLSRLRDTLVSIERLHQYSFRKHGHLRSPEFFVERKRLLSQLDSHLLNSKSLQNLTTLDDHSKLKRALGISSQSLVHHWQAAGGTGPIPGYEKHLKAMSRATKYMQGGGYIGIGLGGVSSLLAVQEVCNAGSEEACRKVRYTEGGKFALSSVLGYYGGEIGLVASGQVCAALGATTGIGGVICVAAVVGIGAYGGTAGGAFWGGTIGRSALRGDDALIRELPLWLIIFITGFPILLLPISVGLSVYISRHHLDEMVSAFPRSRHIVIGAAALMPSGLFGRFVMILKIGGAITCPGPMVRAGEMEAEEIRAFPPHLRKWIKAKIWITIVGFTWGCSVGLIIKLT